MSPDTVESVIAPLTLQKFFDEYWGRKHLLQQRQGTRYSSLLPWSELNRILATEPASVRIAKDGGLVPEQSYSTVRSKTRNEYRYAELLGLLREGATLIINNIDRLHAPIRSLAADFERVFSEYAQINLYAGWGTTKGFDLHWDDHDVFILHLHGKKAWKVYGESRVAPVTKDRDVGLKFAAPPEPLWEVVLEPGDLLYMPRGCWHVATAMAEPTAHLTFGVKNRTGLDFLSWVVDRLPKHEAFRQDLPQFRGSEEISAHVEKLREHLGEVVTVESMRSYLEEYAAGARPKALFALPWQATAEIFPEAHELAIIPLNARVLRFYEPEGGGIAFRMAGKVHSFATEDKAAIRHIFTSRGTTLPLLKEAVGNLDELRISDLLKNLAKSGLVKIEAEGSGEPRPIADARTSS